MNVNNNAFLAVHQNGHTRKSPNRSAFVALPESMVEDIGLYTQFGIRVDAAILSAFAFYGQTSVVRETPGGLFQMSVLRVAENLWSRWFLTKPDTEEFDRFYRRVQKAVGRLKQKGYLKDLGFAHPSGHTTMGSLWTMQDTPLEPYMGFCENLPHSGMSVLQSTSQSYTVKDGMANVVDMIGSGFTSEHALNTYTMCEACYSVDTRGVYMQWTAWEQIVAKGTPSSRFRSIGSFREEDLMDANRSTFVPWFVLDIDRNDPFDAYDEVTDVLYELEYHGVPIDSIFVSYTGGKGYHIRIPAGLFGNPVFASEAQAMKIIRKLYDILSPSTEFDPKVADPRQLIRMPGSCRDGNIQMKMIKGQAFIDMGSHEAVVGECLVHDEQFVPDPRDYPTSTDLVVFLMTANDMTRRNSFPVWNPENEAPEEGMGVGSVSAAALSGVEEGQEWHPPRGNKVYIGRNLAMFIAAGAIMRMGEGKDEAELWAELEEVNRKNQPPLRFSELRSCFKSAMRRGAST